jgi:hypothetical protein
MEHKIIGRRLIDHFKGMVFNEAEHTYKVVGKGLTPVSTFIHNFVKPFVAEKIAPYTAAKEGITTEQCLKNWDNTREEACRNGTMVHDFGERYVIDRYGVVSDLKYSSVLQHLKNDEKLQPKSLALVKFWNRMPDFYYPVALELRMFCEKLGIAGTADIILMDKRDGSLAIFDYKTNKDLFKQYKDQKLLGIFRDMNDCPYSKYKIQLSTYQILLEKTGYKVSRRALVWLKEDGNYEIFDTADITDRIEGYFKAKREYANW